MDTIVCMSCGGVGEVWVLTYKDEEELVSCSTCHGAGQVPIGGHHLTLSAPAKPKRRGENPAILAAIAAIEKQFPKRGAHVIQKSRTPEG